MVVHLKEEKAATELKPVELDEEAANRIVAFLGNQPWGTVNQIMEDTRKLIEGFVVNHHIASGKMEVVNDAVRNNNTSS